MLNLDDFKKYEKGFANLDLSQITSWGKYESDLERGVDGEDKVFEILSKYTTNIKRDVLMWGRKKDRVSEIDFIAEINGYLLIIEAKEWFGKMSLREQKEKIALSYKNTNGKHVERIRTSPIYSLAAFSSDLADYLKPNVPKKDIQLIRYVVFSREDLEFDDSLKEYNTSIRMLSLAEFDEALKELSTKENENPYALEKELPSWDYYFSEKDNKWFRCAVLSQSIETNKGAIETNSIDSIIFADSLEEPSLIKLKNGSVVEAVIDRRTVKVNSSKLFISRFYKYLKLDSILHN